MTNNIFIEKFKKHLSESNYYTCGSVNQDEYYKRLEEMYNSYFDKAKNFRRIPAI